MGTACLTEAVFLSRKFTPGRSVESRKSETLAWLAFALDLFGEIRPHIPASLSADAEALESLIRSAVETQSLEPVGYYGDGGASVSLANAVVLRAGASRAGDRLARVAACGLTALAGAVQRAVFLDDYTPADVASLAGWVCEVRFELAADGSRGAAARNADAVFANRARQILAKARETQS